MRCPLCGGPVRDVDPDSFACERGHQLSGRELADAAGSRVTMAFWSAIEALDGEAESLRTLEPGRGGDDDQAARAAEDAQALRAMAGTHRTPARDELVVPGSTGAVRSAAALSRYLVSGATLGETLQWVAELAVAEVRSAAAVGLTLLEGRRKPVTVFATVSSVSVVVDEAQYADDTGPCLEAYRRRTTVRVGDVPSVAARWPRYARAALDVGVGSTLSVPLTAGAEAYGAINLYALEPYAFTDADVDTAETFATQASVVLANASAYWDARDLATGLSEAMRSRAVIEQAKGKLMASGTCTPDEAFEVLVQHSQRTGVRLRDVAARIVNGLS